MQIQDFLIATIQNITALIAQSHEKISKSNAQRGQLRRAQRATWAGISLALLRIWYEHHLALPFSWDKQAFVR
jgi:hypothetical protein